MKWKGDGRQRVIYLEGGQVMSPDARGRHESSLARTLSPIYEDLREIP
jgi:hypothetical protein